MIVRTVHFIRAVSFCVVLLAGLGGSGLLGCTGPIPPSVERDAARETLNWVDTRYGVIRDPVLDAFLRRVVARLDSAIPVAQREHESAAALEGDLIRYPWQVFVTKQPTINAFSIGGGIMLISQTLVENATTEAELAAVIAHEMSHQLLGHTREALSNVLGQQAHSTPENSAPKNSAPAAVFSQQRELEADSLSLKLLSIARYDTRHALYALMIGHSPEVGSPSIHRQLRADVASQSRFPQTGFVHPIDPGQRERLARIYQAISECPGALPGTQTSREFQRVRARLEAR